MVSVRRRPGVILLAIATMTFSLVLLSATSSGAQTEAEDQGKSAKAAVGDEECVEFGNEDSDLATDEVTGTDTSGLDEGNSLDATSDDATDPDASDNTADSAASDSENENATDENTDTGGDAETNTGTDTTNQDTGTGNQDAGTGTNGEDFTTAQDEEIGSEDDTTSQDDGAGSDGTTSSQDEEAGNEECVVADTVPDEDLLPTGAPVKS